MLLGWAGGAWPTTEQCVLLVELLVLAGIASRIEFKIGLNGTIISPFAQPIMIGMLYLPSWQIAALALVVGVVIDLHRRDPWLMLLYNAASLSLPTLVGAELVRVTTGLHPEGAWLLPAALIAAVVHEFGNAVGFAAYLEHRHPLSLRAFVRQVPAIVTTQIVLSTIVILIVAPYIDMPWAFALVFLAFQGVSYLGIRLANSEQIQRRRGDHLQKTFSRYVPASVVSELAETGTEVELGGQEREITVLFSDIRGFTSWSEHRRAAEIITELNALLAELSAAVINHEGTLDKFTGDGLMAFWGAPLPMDDHAARACHAALDMLERLDAHNAERIADGDQPFAIGIGVHSGPAVVGNVGHEERLDYTAIGDTVNLSARLEAMTKEVGSALIVSADTHERLPAELQDRAMHIGDITVKGRLQPVEVFALVPRRPDRDSESSDEQAA